MVRETVNEGMNQIVFMKEGKVVCYIYGYPSNNKYGISLNSSEEATTLYAKNNEKFKVLKEDGITYLNREEKGE